MSSSKKVTVGYRYRLGIHMVLCHGPVDSISRINVDDRPVWTGSNSGGNLTISAENHFGGEDKEGGISGSVSILMGSGSQARNSYLMSKLGSAIPAYRGVVSAVLNQVYIGMSPYLRAWSFWATRIMQRTDGGLAWYPEKAAIGQDMNPAHILQECITDGTWGMGYTANDIDNASFTLSADQLHAESMGISILWDKSMPLEEFIQEILKHIQGSLYVSRETGKFVLKLARYDYNTEDNSLLVLDESNVSKVSDYKKSNIGELFNQVTVVFWDASTGKTNSITVQDIALAGQQQATVGTTKQFPGFTNSALASRVAARELKATSTPIASVTIMANRVAAELNVGSVFKFRWPKFGISEIIMRVVNMELGDLNSNIVRIMCVEDVFAIDASSYITPSDPEWTDPVGDPTPCPVHVTFEAPYWELAQRMGDTVAANIPGTSSYAMVTASAPTGYSENSRLYSRKDGVNFADSGQLDYTVMSTLSASVGLTETTLPVTGFIGVVATGTYLIVDQEYMRIDAVSDTSITVGRGCLDSVPVTHAAGARVVFADDTCETDGQEYALSESATYKVCPTTPRGTLPLVSAPTLTQGFVGRHHKPYPPAGILINGSPYPAAIGATSPLVVTWAHRNRLTQTANLVATGEPSITPEIGVTVTIQLRTAGGALLLTKTGLVGTTDTLTLVEMGANYGSLRLQVFSVRDGVESWQKHDILFTRTAP